MAIGFELLVESGHRKNRVLQTRLPQVFHEQQMVERAVYAAEKLAAVAVIVRVVERIDDRIEPFQRPGVVVGHETQMLMQIHGLAGRRAKCGAYAL